MIEFGELNFTGRFTQIGSALSSMMGAISRSRTNYWAAYAVDLTCPILFGYLGMRYHPGWASILIGTIFGFAVFTLVEYAIHRWLLHDPECFLYPLHEAHHQHPEGAAAFLAPTSFVVLMPIWLLFAGWLHVPGASFFLCGFSAGYFYFGALHHLEHAVRINQIPFRWLQGRWAAHSVHHKLDHANYGVMTSFWDYVFGTHQKQLKKRRSMGV
jgi:sterol desaturase/sphingolipid hydroxylase (fatty acid hydroxylase superfamily)